MMQPQTTNMADAGLSAEQKAAFDRDGHVVVPGILDPAYVVGMVDGFREYVAQQHQNLNSFERSLGASATSATFHLPSAPDYVQALVTDPQLAALAADLLVADRVRVLHFNGFFKPGGGMATPWHQDQGYIPLDCAAVLTLWVPLVSISQQMGGLMFASGSHQDRETSLRDISDRFTITENPPMDVGDVSCHLGWTAHRSRPNTTQKMRAAVAISYYPDGACVRLPQGGPPMMQSLLNDCLPGLADGDIARGPAVPVVYDRNAA